MVATLISTAFMALLLVSGWSIVHDLTRPLDIVGRVRSSGDDSVVRSQPRLADGQRATPAHAGVPAAIRRSATMPRIAPHALAA